MGVIAATTAVVTVVTTATTAAVTMPRQARVDDEDGGIDAEEADAEGGRAADDTIARTRRTWS